ncbi:hypothetical protein JB92DRAFT_2961445 [Gautieria morchelliformis]|nr:hypothetical protein JB92DRAFT_2961445 [Gautieria morchelliformis]
MPSISSWLSDISRRKLRTAASGRDGLRDSINLHRFVLLKNSITHAESPSPSLSSQSSLLVPDGDHSEVIVLPDTKPVTMSLGRHPDTTPTVDSEEKWLESVLETLDDDFDREVEVEVHQVDDNDLDFLDSASQDSFESWVPPYDGLPIPSDNFLSAPTPVLSPQFQPPPSLQFLLNSPDSHFNQPYVEPRYPEADLDLPLSETNSDSESDDDDGPLTPYSGSQPSLGEHRTAEPEVYIEHDSYFLYPSELDPILPSVYYQQC